MKYLSENWYWISGVIVLVINLINTATRHWSTHQGLVRWLLLVSEFLSVLKSAGEPAGRLGNIKVPGTVIGSNNIFPVILLVAIGFGTGCTTTSAMQAIDTSVKGVQLASDLAMPFVHKKCMSEAMACAAKKDQVCEAWKACDDARGKLKLAVDTIQDELVIAAKIIEAVCKDGGCK